MRKRIWNDEMIAVLKELYPVENIETVACRLGVGKSAVKSKAIELGIEKGIKRAWLEKAMAVRELHPTHSISEISEKIGVSPRTISRIISLLGLHRGKESEKNIRSRIRTDMIKREKRRMVFGLQPITKLKVVSNRKKITFRHKLKAIGCEVSRNATTIYYSDNNCLQPEHFVQCEKLGLRLIPILE